MAIKQVRTSNGGNGNDVDLHVTGYSSIILEANALLATAVGGTIQVSGSGSKLIVNNSGLIDVTSTGELDINGLEVVKSGGTLSVEGLLRTQAGSSFEMLGAGLIGPDATLALIGTSGHLAIIETRQYGRIKIIDDSVMQVQGSSGHVGTLLIDQYGVLAVQNGGILATDASSSINQSGNRTLIGASGFDRHRAKANVADADNATWDPTATETHLLPDPGASRTLQLSNAVPNGFIFRVVAPGGLSNGWTIKDSAGNNIVTFIITSVVTSVELLTRSSGGLFLRGYSGVPTIGASAL